MAMQKNEQLELAYNFVQFTDKNIFLTGKAGTGKTTFLRKLKQNCLKRMVIVAPTGVAAINAGGVTIHSFFQLPFGPYVSSSVSENKETAGGQHRKFNRDKINLLQSLDLLVIDEISMVRADVLDGIDEVLRKYKNRNKPFGGVQLLMIGDLHQLSPVVRDEDWRILKDFYPNLYFFSSKALQQTAHVCIELKHIYRQSDTYFIDILNKIRENRIDQNLLEELNQRFIPGFEPADNEGYITLTTHNAVAQEINRTKLTKLKSSAHAFSAVISMDFPEYSYPTDVELELKVGAQVMFVKNDSSREKLFYNGKIGTVTRIEDEVIAVKCSGDDCEIEVVRAEWNNLKYELNTETKEVEEKVIGTFIQFPLKLAWAITIHKSQGLTFEKAVIDASSSFAHGQVYVALSRCKSFEGMVLRSPILFNSVKTDGTVSVYTRKAEENAPGEKQLLDSKIEFQQSLVRELFDFNSIKGRFFYFKKVLEENDAFFATSVLDDINKVRESAENTIYGISQKFQNELLRISGDSRLPEENAELQERVRKAAAYFQEKSESLLASVSALRVDTDNKAIRKSVDETFESLRKEIIIKIGVLKSCRDGFRTIVYLKSKADSEIDYSPAKTASSAAKETVNAGIANFALYERIKKWRDELARENNVPVYIILPSKVLVQLVAALPRTLSELEAIKGIGKQKIRQFGQEILNMIASFCRERGIDQSSFNQPLKEEKTKVDTKQVSFDLFKSGKSIDEIATERGFTYATIEGHLVHFVGLGQLDIFKIVSPEKVELISNFIRRNNPDSSSSTKAALGDEFSYGEIRAVMKYMALSVEQPTEESSS